MNLAQNFSEKLRKLDRRWQVVILIFAIVFCLSVMSLMAGRLAPGGAMAVLDDLRLKAEGYAEGQELVYEPQQLYENERKQKEMSLAAGAAKDEYRSRAASPAPLHSQQAAEYFQPMIIKTANVSLTVKDVEAGMQKLENLATSNFGIITSQNLTAMSQGQGPRYGSLTVRVPSDKLSGFLEQLREIGKVTSQSQNGQDVSGEAVDLESRIKNLKAEEQALQGIMTRSGKIPHVLEVSRELARVRGEIESAQGRLNYLKHQVSYSTITLNITEEFIAPATGKPSFITVMANTFTQALEGLYNVGVASLQFIIWLLVLWLPILGVLALLTRVAWEVLRRAWHSVGSAFSRPAA